MAKRTKINFTKVLFLKISTISFILISAVPNTLFGFQSKKVKVDNDKTKTVNQFNYRLRSFLFFSYADDSMLEPRNPFDFVDGESILYGMNISVNYKIIDGISVGLGSGIEKFEIPSFNFVPFFSSIVLNGGSKKNSFHLESNIGGHFIKNEKTGILFRIIAGYRFNIHKKFFSDLSLVYTFQNLYKTFENSGRDDNYYNFESIGISAALEIF